MIDHAEQRRILHLGSPSSRPLSRDYEVVGWAGECAFGRAIGQKPDATPRPSGDKGIDFTVACRVRDGVRSFTVDVKTARKPHNLLVEVGKVHASIYVLDRFIAPEQADLLGWEWAALVRPAPTGVFYPSNPIPSHYIPAGRLRPMAELLGRVVTA